MFIFTSIGGCSVKQKAHTKQVQTATSSSTKEDIEVIKQKQLAYLKEHEQEIVNFVKSKSSKLILFRFIGTKRNGLMVEMGPHKVEMRS